MDDYGGLDLGLGLSCGGSSSKAKNKVGSSSDSHPDEADIGSKVVDDFKSFLHAGIQEQDQVVGGQQNGSINPQDSFFSFSKSSVDVEASINLNGRSLWAGNNNKSSELEEEKVSEASSKRKSFFDDANHPKKIEREAHLGSLHDRAKPSHISITTDEGSTAENEDVAESEVDGSTSRLASNHEEGRKRYIDGGAACEAPKEIHIYQDSNLPDSQVETRSNIPLNNEFKFGNMAYNIPYAIRPTIMAAPYSLSVKEFNNAGSTGVPVYPPRGVIPMMHPVNGDRPANPGNLPLAFGYSPVQLPVLDKEHSWGIKPHPQQVHPSYVGRATTGGVTTNPDMHNGSKALQVSGQFPPPGSSEVPSYNGRVPELARGEGKQHASEESFSSRMEDDAKRNNINFKAKDTSTQPAPAETFSHIGAIRPGMVADLKFGGSGSNPNLPWVSTRGPGPNGKTISGVTYRFNANQIKIVCACHGSHMSPEEFVRHAGEEHDNPENGNASASFPSNNPAASAQS